MLRLASLIYTMAAPTLAGILILVPLTAPKLTGALGLTMAQSIIGCAVAGALLAIPVAFAVASALRKATRTGG